MDGEISPVMPPRLLNNGEWSMSNRTERSVRQVKVAEVWRGTAGYIGEVSRQGARQRGVVVGAWEKTSFYVTITPLRRRIECRGKPTGATAEAKQVASSAGNGMQGAMRAFETSASSAHVCTFIWR